MILPSLDAKPAQCNAAGRTSSTLPGNEQFLRVLRWLSGPLGLGSSVKQFGPPVSLPDLDRSSKDSRRASLGRFSPWAYA